MIKRVLCAAVIYFFIITRSFAQQQPYTPLRIDVPITLDGKLDEPEWQKADVMDDFMQTDPNPGAPPTQKTEVRILYDDQYMYVGVIAYEPSPKKLIRIGLERDFNLGEDDETVCVFDTYHDKSSGFVFASNTLDARWDAQVTNDGGNVYSSFDTYWDVATSIDSNSYTTEYRIPFSSLRFASKPIVTMGFRFTRLNKRKNEQVTYPKLSPKIQTLWDNVSKARDIVFYNLRCRRPFYITPYIIADYAGQNILNASGTDYTYNSNLFTRKNFVDNETFDKILSNVGVDAKYGISKNLTVDMTVNTDFAQTEVDDIIINLTKYAVNLPEKRNFFLESLRNLTYTFNAGNEMFISRSIGIEKGIVVPIIGGARVTGKIGKWQMGLLDMQTAGVSADSILQHNFFVFRTRRDIDTLGSFIGGIITNRSNTNGDRLSNQAVGIDVLKVINPTLSLSGNLAATSANASVKDLGSSAYYSVAIFRNVNKGFTYNGSLDIVGQNFNPVMGYLDEPNYGLAYVNAGYTTTGSTKSPVEYWYFFTHDSYRWYLNSGKQETEYADFYPGVTFRSGAHIEFSVFEYKVDSLSYNWNLDPNNAIEAGTYKTFNNTVTMNSPQNSVYSGTITASYGGFYGGKRFAVSPTLTYAFTKNFNIALTYQYNHITFSKYLTEDINTLYQSHLVRLNVSCLLSTKFSVKLYTQYDNIGHLVTSNLRIRYNPREGTDLYIVINQGLNTELDSLNPHLPQVNTQEFTIKYSRTFGG